MKYLYIFITIAILLLLGASVYLLPRNVKVSHVYCSDQFGECEPGLQESLQVGIGRDLISAQKDVRGVLGFNTLISDYSVDFTLPDTLSVEVVRRKPTFALSNGSDLVALVDANGIVVGYTPDTLLPQMVVTGGFSEVGKSVGEGQLFALQLISGVNYMDEYSSAELFDDYLGVRLRSGTTVNFPLTGDVEILLGSLVMILSKLDSDPELRSTVSTIDLRFENPVLR